MCRVVGNSPCAALPVQLQGRAVNSTTARATDALEPGFLCDGAQSSRSPVGLRLEHHGGTSGSWAWRGLTAGQQAPQGCLPTWPGSGQLS